MNRPNVLWVVMDTARRDAFEPYGAPAGATPVVADLSRRGVAAPDVRSTACWTLPSHVSMFAGQLPRAAGFADQAGLHPDNARPAVEALKPRMIAEVLRRSGYATSAVSANLWVSERSGFSVGFDRFVEAHTDRQARMAAPARRDALAWSAESVRGRVDDGARSALATIRRWTDEAPAIPFLWFVNLVECHSPYLPPRPYGGMSLRQRLHASREARRFLTQAGVWRACVTGVMPSDAALARMRSLYAGSIRYMDDWLGEVLRGLERSGRLDDTLVIVTSDHGENFGEGDLLAHGFSLDDRLIHVPFVAAGPGSESLRDVRSLAELPMRLAEIAGASDHPYRSEDVPPIAVAQFDPPVPLDDHRTHRVIADWQLSDDAIGLMTTSQTAAIDGSVKLVTRTGGEAFYDLEADPLEAEPRPADAFDDQVVRRLRDALADPAATESRSTWSRGGEPGPSPAPQDVADLEDRMRLLGYL